MRRHDIYPTFGQIPLLGFVGFRGAGKTTALTRLLPLLTERGLRVGVVKHAGSGFDLDQPGKDSFELRGAGALQVVVASRERWALMVETPEWAEPRLPAILARLDPGALDLVLVEGFHHEPVPKIEIHRPSLGRPLLSPGDRHIVAVATDQPLPCALPVPILDLNAAWRIRDFVLHEVLAGRGMPRAAQPARTASRNDL